MNMVATIQLTAANRDLVSYFTNWSNNFGYNGNGEFNPATQPYDQWSAGTGNAANTGVILNGDFTYQPPGGFGGTVNSLQFGTDLNGTAATGWSLGTPGLTVGLTGSDISASSGFTEAIYSLSHGGSLTGVVAFGTQFAGLYDYFGNVGTAQTGTALVDKLYSFDGDDTLNGLGGRDTFVFDRDIDGALSASIGDDTVSGFTAGANGDFIDLTGLQSSAFDTFAEVYAAAHQEGANTVIDFGDLGSITLNGVTKTALVQGNFLLPSAPALAEAA
jgi:hypothetical protein